MPERDTIDNFDLRMIRQRPENYSHEIYAEAIGGINGLLRGHESIGMHQKDEMAHLVGVETVEEYAEAWGRIFGEDSSHVVKTAKGVLGTDFGAAIHGHYGLAPEEVYQGDQPLIDRFGHLELAAESVLDYLDMKYPGPVGTNLAISK